MTVSLPRGPISGGARTATVAPARAWATVAREAARDRVNQVVFATSALLVGFGYSVLLPYAYTQRISLANWHYLDARYLAFSVAFALGLGWLVTLQVHAVRRLVRNSSAAAARTGPVGAIAAVVSVLPSLLCCSPILPTLVGLIGLSAGARLSTTVQLQHFFATKENLILLGALALLAASGLWSLRKLARASCPAGECCTSTGDADQPNPVEAHRTDGPISRPVGLSAARAESAQR